MSAILFIEGGGGNDLNARCRENFQKLLKKCGFEGRMPKAIPCGSRNEAFRSFQIELKGLKPKSTRFVAMLIDSEDPIEDIEKTWEHLARRDSSWEKPKDAEDEQVLFMTTCMETWIIADRETLVAHYGEKLQIDIVPREMLEGRRRHFIQKLLTRATRNCSNAYQKGKRSFEILGKLNPKTLQSQLPSFARVLRILQKSL